ncbi:MAG: ABC transporter permease [Proteobacteria bacterium]|nr:ABC transporter permease [Pseudomonadota bacterium]
MCKAVSKKVTLHIPVPQVCISLFLLLLFCVALRIDIPVSWLISDALIRLVMNGVLVLALVPMLKTGIGLNFGLPVGILAGLVGLCVAVNFRMTGLAGLFYAMVISIPIAALFGMIYAFILNRVKGREEITATFVGFSFVPLMNFFWAVAPFSNPSMLWPIGGQGMRPAIGLKRYFAKSLNSLGSFSLAGVTIPLGMILFFLALCFAVHLFFKTRLGQAMMATGENERFALISGIKIRNMRTIAIVMSTVIAALGICVYAQSYGFIELYDAPMMMAFPAVSAILVGGSLKEKTTLTHVILGTFLFQTIYSVSGPVANDLLIPEVAEIFRLMITNGVILAALLYEGGRHKKI